MLSSLCRRLFGNKIYPVTRASLPSYRLVVASLVVSHMSGKAVLKRLWCGSGGSIDAVRICGCGDCCCGSIRLDLNSGGLLDGLKVGERLVVIQPVRQFIMVVMDCIMASQVVLMGRLRHEPGR